MSQVIFSTIDPTISGTTLATTLNNFKDALMTGCSGTSKPTETAIGGSWVDTTNAPTSWSYRIWTGTDNVEIFKINLTTGVASVALAVDSFTVKKISADTIAAVMELVKRRIATNGQVLDGDVVGEIRMVGRTNTSTNPVVAKIIFTATDNETTSAYGGTLSFWSTPDATATLTEHMKFINGLIETIVPLKVNSLIYASQDVATAATIAALSAAKILVELTGSTATDIQGLNAAHDSKVVTIHNRSTANITLKHLNGGAAAADQIKLPASVDYVIQAEGAATLFYCTTDTKWKIQSTSDKVSGNTIDTIYAFNYSWAAPASLSQARVTAFRLPRGAVTSRSAMIDFYGNAYAWGSNANGQLGVGDVTPRSSPVAVLGGFSFERIMSEAVTGGTSYGIADTGNLYAWGLNTNGQLGDATVVPKSSPVAVVGGLRFLAVFTRDASTFGITTNGLLYSWGINTNGQLGLGTVTPVSSPVAVLRGFTYAKAVPLSGAAAAMSVVGLDRTGVAYAWGINTNGNLGVGDVTPRSSPVAVLGSLTFADVRGMSVSTRYSYVGLTTAGAAYAWGSNTNSNLGIGDQNARSSPIAVLGGLTFTQLVTHPKTESVMALNSAGTLYAWGDNTKGVLGDGTSVNKSSPVAVLGGLTFKKAKVFKSVAFGLTSDGTLYSWGDNANGQLGHGDVVAKSSPVAVLGGLKFTDVFFADGPTDQYSVMAITSDGLMYSWGANANGTLGIGSVTPQSSPVAVLGAFAPDYLEFTKTIDLAVTGGNSYTVTTGPGVSMFGINPLLRDAYKVEIEYLS